MDKTFRRFPFPTSFQFRDDERAGLEALFMRTFFDVPFSTEARQSLIRTLFQRAEGQGQSAPRAPSASALRAASGGEERPSTSSFDATASPPSSCSYPGDAARHVLLYRGADGIGKTRVFRQFRESARKKQIPVYEIYHHDVEGIPFKPFLHAVREILRDHDQGAALQEKYRYGLEALLPELYMAGADSEALATDIARPTPAERRDALSSGSLEFDEGGKVRIFDAITQLLIEVTAQKPLVILVHDLHWSDRPTIELLDYIGRNLQLRNCQASDASTGALSSDPGLGAVLNEIRTGPELDDFESDEWRTLTRSGPGAHELLGVPYYAFPPSSPRGDSAFPPSSPRGDDALLPGLRADGGLTSSVLQGEESDAPAGNTPPLSGGQNAPEELAATIPSRPGSGPRLMILANYRGFPDPSHYLEQAVRALGDKPFAYHGELRPLSRAEADSYLQASLEGVEIEGRQLEQLPDCVDAIYEASEGFPSFMQELFRAIYLREGGFASANEPPHVWSGRSIQAALASAAHPLGPAPSEEDGQPPGPRHAILRLRLSSASRDEQRVLQAMATARRPVKPAFLGRVLDGLLDPLPAEDRAVGSMLQGLDRMSSALEALEERGLIERVADHHEAGESGYFFRLWDYTIVVEETIPADERRILHQRVGEEYQSRFDESSDEAAFEVFYHLRRGLEPRSALRCGLLAARRFVRSFALEKARRIQNRLIDLLNAPGDLIQRMELLAQMARISMALKEGPVAEDIARRAQTEGASHSSPGQVDAAVELSPECKVELILLEAEAARLGDAGRALKILGKATKHLKDENTPLGVRLQLATARLRLESQDLKRAINFSLKGTSICQKLGDVPELGELYRTMASAFYRKGDYAHAVDNYQRALDAFERMGLKNASVGALDELGRVYLERGNYFRAARYLYKSLEIRRRQHDLPGLSRSYDELGRVYLRSGDYLKTIENLNRSLALKERIGDTSGLNPTLVILGDLYFRLGRYEQSLAYFKREVENSQRLGDTRGLVEGLGQLGRAHFELGDAKQAEIYSKQVSILASEFKLRSQEADGALLEGNLRALSRDWTGAEKNFKLAAEIHGKLGHRRREICAYLDLADVKLVRELFDESLKFASKGQLIADQVKALDLQVRALTIKGNIHRFLKGGNIEKAREFLHKALELSQGLSDVSTLFQLFYSLAKVCHSQREFAEAASYYGKAELILKQTGEALSEDRSARFFEDKRRKIFAEDIARFRKEALGRASGAAVEIREPQATAVGLKDRPVGFADYKDLALRILRVQTDLNQLHFHDRLLAEAVELSGAERGFVLRVQNRQYFPVAYHGFGKNPAQHPEFQAASGVAQEAVRRGRSILATGPGEIAPEKAEKTERQEKGLHLGPLGHCSILAVPFMTDERIFGGVYLDKPVVVGQFLPRNQVLLEAFAQHAAVALSNRRELETAIREPLTGFFTPSYFIERLREAYRWFNLHGKAFTLIGYFVPSLEEALGGGRGELAQNLARDLSEALPHRAAVCWGSPVLHVLLGEGDLAQQDEVAGRVRDRLSACFGEEVPMEVLPAHSRYHQGAEIYFEMRRRLVPEVCDRKILTELRALLAPDITLRDAKKILEKHKIETTLRKTGGNITHAARELGIHRPQLSNLLKKYSLKRGIFETDLDGDGFDVQPDPSDN